jgi:hypothetical protein
MRIYNNWVQHIANPLHVYCRLIDFGMNENFSKRLSIIYEKYCYNFLRKDQKGTWNFTGKGSSS